MGFMEGKRWSYVRPGARGFPGNNVLHLDLACSGVANPKMIENPTLKGPTSYPSTFWYKHVDNSGVAGVARALLCHPSSLDPALSCRSARNGFNTNYLRPGGQRGASATHHHLPWAIQPEQWSPSSAHDDGGENIKRVSLQHIPRPCLQRADMIWAP